MTTKVEELLARLKGMKTLRVKAGVMGGGEYIDTHEKVYNVAVWNEFGTSKTPARPFLRVTVAKNRDEWLEGAGKGLMAYLEGKTDLHTVGDKLGVVMQTHILETIDSNLPPPNSEATYKRKLNRKFDPDSSTPKAKQLANAAHTITTLVDSGFMRDSVSYEVEV